MISLLLVLILFGGVFLTSELFKDVDNNAKTYLIVISSILLVAYFISRNRFHKLIESLKSRNLLYGVGVVCILTSIHGFIQYFGIIPSNHSAFPITGSFENPAGFASAQAAMFPFVITNCFDRRNRKFLQLFSIVTSLFCLISVVLSGSRTGFLALISTCVVVFAFSPSVVFFKTHKWLYTLLFITIASLLIALYYVKQDSADGRLFIWNRCLEMIKERPLFGYGTYGFHRYYMSTQAIFFKINTDSPFIMLADNVSHPFNEYIKLTINYGIVGLFAALGLLAWIVCKLFSSDRQTKILSLSFVTSLFIMCQFSYPFRYAVVWLLSFIAIIPAIVRSDTENIKLSMYIRISVTTILFLFLTIITRKMYCEMKWTEISKRSVMGQSERMLKYYEGLKPVMKNNPLFLYNYAAELDFSGHHEESLAMLSQCMEMWNDYDVQILFADNYAYINDKEKAILSYENAHNMIPCRFAPLYGKMLIYKNFNDTINALLIANEIVEKNIKVSSDRVSYIIEQAQQVLLNYSP